MGAIKECIFHWGDVQREFREERFVEGTILQRNEKFSRITGRRRSITGGYASMINHLPVANSFTKFARQPRRDGDAGAERVESGVPGPGL